MARHWTEDKPLLEPKMTAFTYANMSAVLTMCYNNDNKSSHVKRITLIDSHSYTYIYESPPYATHLKCSLRNRLCAYNEWTFGKSWSPHMLHSDLLSMDASAVIGQFLWGDVLKHQGRDKMDAIPHTTSPSTFSWIKMFEFRLKFHWSLYLRVELTIFQHWLS